MRRKLLVLGVFALLVVGFAVPIAAQAGWIAHWSGDSAYASFSETQGNISTQIWLEAMKGKYQSPPGNGTNFSRVFAYIYSWDTSSGDVVAGGWGYKELGAKEFSVSGGLKAAALETTVPMNDFVTGDMFDLAVRVNWTGNGRPIRERIVYQYIYPGMHYSSTYTNASKAADAQGTFTKAGSVVFSGTTAWAMIGSGRNREILIN